MAVGLTKDYYHRGFIPKYSIKVMYAEVKNNLGEILCKAYEIS